MIPCCRSGYRVHFYGANECIGSQMVVAWKETHSKDKVTISNTNIDPSNFSKLYKEIQQAERVVCFVEQLDNVKTPLYKNLHDNLVGPMMLATLCQQLDVHLLYVSIENITSCIHEEDKPTFVVLEEYSTVRGCTHEMMKWHSNIVCNCHVRMPVMHEDQDPKSLTYIQNIIPTLVELSREAETGTFNF